MLISSTKVGEQSRKRGPNPCSRAPTLSHVPGGLFESWIALPVLCGLVSVNCGRGGRDRGCMGGTNNISNQTLGVAPSGTTVERTLNCYVLCFQAPDSPGRRSVPMALQAEGKNLPSRLASLRTAPNMVGSIPFYSQECVQNFNPKIV